MRTIKPVILFMVLLLSVTASATEYADDSVRVFPVSYFAEFEPRSAIELVQQVPGFRLKQSGGGRGLSNLRSNVLIDGVRPPPKGKTLSALLSELPVRSVLQLELITLGSRPELDMQGYRQVLNVVTRKNRPPFIEGSVQYSRDGTGDVATRNATKRSLAVRGALELDAHQLSGKLTLDDSRQQSPGSFSVLDQDNPTLRVSSVTQSDANGRDVEGGGIFKWGADRTLSINTRYSQQQGASYPLGLEHSTDDPEISRSVGQLSFAQFLASASLTSSVVTAGATDLEPVKMRNHSVLLDHRFDDKGVFDIRVSRAITQNPINTVPLSDTVVVSQNTAAQTLDTLSSRLSMSLDDIGFEGAHLNLGGSLANSTTVDPVTGQVRAISGSPEASWSFGLSKEPSKTPFNWGIGLADQERGSAFGVRSISDSQSTLSWNGYFAWSPQASLKFRSSIRGPSYNRTSSELFATARALGDTPSHVSNSESESAVSLTGSVEWRPAETVEFILTAATGSESLTRQSVNAYGAVGQIPLEQRVPASPNIGLQLRLSN